MREVYLEIGGVKSLYLNSDEFVEYCSKEDPEIKDENYFDGDDESWINDFISNYLEKKYKNKIFELDYDHKSECFTIYKTETSEE
jgi:hypothetical protein